jgi:Cation transport protein
MLSSARIDENVRRRVCGVQRMIVRCPRPASSSFARATAASTMVRPTLSVSTVPNREHWVVGPEVDRRLVIQQQVIRGEVLDLVFASVSTLGKTGPGLGPGGTNGSFAAFGDASTVAMTLPMWVGRLEILPVVVLLRRSYRRL